MGNLPFRDRIQAPFTASVWVQETASLGRLLFVFREAKGTVSWPSLETDGGLTIALSAFVSIF